MSSSAASTPEWNPPADFPSRRFATCAKIVTMPRRTRLATALTFLVLTVAASAEGFIRVDEDDRAARLQTAVTRYERDGATVDLIGAIHIADKEYYEALSARFEKYDVLLFEMIGGERLGAKRGETVETERLNSIEDKPAEEVSPVTEEAARRELLPEAGTSPETATEVPEAQEPAAAPAKKPDLSGLHQIYNSICR
ncbi:MAG: hypothetical protein EOP85_15325, partial [Verrucomicrobiaceae bacterium]